jgi:hypothetical protein
VRVSTPPGVAVRAEEVEESAWQSEQLMSQHPSFRLPGGPHPLRSNVTRHPLERGFPVDPATMSLAAMEISLDGQG